MHNWIMQLKPELADDFRYQRAKAITFDQIYKTQNKEKEIVIIRPPELFESYSPTSVKKDSRFAKKMVK